MRIITMFAALCLLFVVCGGCVFTHVKTPYDTDLDNTQLGAKKGESSLSSVLWLVAWGDAGTASAAKEGDITTLRHMDQEILSVLFGLYYHQTTIVYGD